MMTREEWFVTKAFTEPPDPRNGYVLWPKEFPVYNGCNEPCDMWTGPCVCGAFHRDGDAEHLGIKRK
jgi:hypothetical protein